MQLAPTAITYSTAPMANAGSSSQMSVAGSTGAKNNAASTEVCFALDGFGVEIYPAEHRQPQEKQYQQ